MSIAGILKGSIILGFFYIASKFLSFIVEVLIAAYFGPCIETDIYYLIDSIVNSLLPMLTVGIWKVYMPEYKSLVVNEKKNDAYQLTSNLIIVFTILSTIFSLILFFNSNLIIKAFAPGFNTEMTKHASYLLRLISPVFVFATLTTFPTAIFQSNNNFAKSQVKEILYFLFPIITLLFFKTNTKIEYLIYSIIIAYIASCIFQYYLWKERNILKFSKRIFNKKTKALLKLFPVASINAIILQLNNIIDKVFSSTLAVGSITCLNYGSKIVHLFDGLFSTAISVAVFPHITELYAKNERSRFALFFTNYLITISAILCPLSLILFVFSNQIVGVLFGYGKFDAESIAITSNVLRMYAIGFVAMGLTTITNDVFFITKNIRKLLFTTLINISSNIILDFLLINKFGVSGLCLATTFSLFITLFIKWIMIKHLIYIQKSHIYTSFHIIISLCISVLVYKLYTNYTVYKYGDLITLLIGSSIIVLCYIIVLLSISKEMRSKTLNYIWKK